MIGITKLYCGTATTGDPLRYGRKSEGMPAHLLQYSADKKPIVVWNGTRRCNLKCIHCYADSDNKAYPNEMSTEEIQTIIRDLGEFGAPVFLFSGGEPLIREDMYENAALCKELGIRPVISTNGTLITEKVAERIKETDFGYVGISAWTGSASRTTSSAERKARSRRRCAASTTASPSGRRSVYG